MVVREGWCLRQQQRLLVVSGGNQPPHQSGGKVGHMTQAADISYQWIFTVEVRNMPHVAGEESPSFIHSL